MFIPNYDSPEGRLSVDDWEKLYIPTTDYAFLERVAQLLEVDDSELDRLIDRVEDMASRGKSVDGLEKFLRRKRRELGRLLSSISQRQRELIEDINSVAHSLPLPMKPTD